MTGSTSGIGYGKTAKGFAADTSRAEGTAAIHTAFPNVDILVNNVGGYGPQAFEQSIDIVRSSNEVLAMVSSRAGPPFSQTPSAQAAEVASSAADQTDARVIVANPMAPPHKGWLRA